jgi:hypothetical protein
MRSCKVEKALYSAFFVRAEEHREQRPSRMQCGIFDHPATGHCGSLREEHWVRDATGARNLETGGGRPAQNIRGDPMPNIMKLCPNRAHWVRNRGVAGYPEIAQVINVRPFHPQISSMAVSRPTDPPLSENAAMRLRPLSRPRLALALWMIGSSLVPLPAKRRRWPPSSPRPAAPSP